ncbi:MAG: flagellar motor stator protein MotA [Ectothiorhodospiraceae bacterium]|nr:flagellar motor stator protein MotA [Ectothiorhodospiraceae bacterium]MBN4053081.1 flagellar motor stator protein MotA [Gammaproteobacteria bacterium AH-315-K14]
MKFIIGVIIVLGCVGGGFVLSHGHLAALWQPFELVIICGAAFGAFVISNPGTVIKDSFGSIGKLLSGSKHNKASYMELLALMYDLFTKARKEGLMALEGDIDEPHESPIFQKYPKILKNHHALDFIADYLRLMVGGNMNPFEIENLMDVELDTHHHEAAKVPTAFTAVSDALPGFGIVAAVLGIVITMASIGGPVEELGKHVAAALVGTFLGILFAYGFVGPMATSLTAMNEDDSKVFECIKVCLLASLNGYAPQISVEFGRKTLESHNRPGFQELEDFVKGKSE